MESQRLSVNIYMRHMRLSTECVSVDSLKDTDVHCIYNMQVLQAEEQAPK